MKRKGSILLTPKKKKQIEFESDNEEDRAASDSEIEQAAQDDDDQDENSEVDQSEEDQATDEDEDDEQGSDELEDAEESDDEQQEQDSEEDNNEENAEHSDQQESGNEDDGTERRIPARKQPIIRGKVQRVTPLLKKKKRKPGVIYICSIPKHMNVTILRSLLEPFGEIGRVYLQPSQKDGKVRMKTAQGKRAMVQYTEGWVEFLDKRVAKQVVPLLNMHPITNKKKSAFRDILWSMKYLSGFKWVHLNERLTYERAVAKEKMREQIQQIRKEVSYHETKIHHKEMALKNAAREKKEAKAKKNQV
ncbi:pre-rRNA-processing protein esf-2-like [Anopheles stephensi]|uniref:Activator of basal transcription 1 n=1 Tax=Anopheles stephensi TaxID=30069 RepID=A0A182YP41_ANOST|nr:pre-rRNA-processing protein esf-2-like [Anopheles stephensi]